MEEIVHTVQWFIEDSGVHDSIIGTEIIDYINDMFRGPMHKPDCEKYTRDYGNYICIIDYTKCVQCDHHVNMLPDINIDELVIELKKINVKDSHMTRIVEYMQTKYTL